MNDRVEELFLKAREILDPEERTAFLSEACRGAPDLLAQVQRLLDDESQAESFFGESESNREAATIILKIDAEEAGDSGEREGQWIGRYRLLQRIGEGGFGSVWMAEQTEPVTRRVALKIIKQGMDTKEVIARFESERQALAMMDHPNIAKVFDAGATETGRPYFVMELVKGKPVTKFCDEWKLDTEQRLLLFGEICSAINHAHQKGIIHRDIKPSNVMVTLHGDRPVPMVIDFGIAKATEVKLTAKTVFTRFDQFIGTPAYMSPEQVGMSGLDVDTRSDIYSLGVLLYELLAGSPPFDPKTLISAGYDEMRRIICEVDPPRPSLKISTATQEESHRIQDQLGASPQRLGRLLKGDLDWIVMKALEKDRSRRYESANALADDIKHYLATEPVVARPPSRLYEFQKTVRRHKFGFAATTAIVLVLAGGVLVSTWQAIKAQKAQRDAEEARDNEQEQRALAEIEQARAESGEKQAREQLYAANMNLIQQAWDQNDIRRFKSLLNETSLNADRGFEWYYWQRQLHREQLTLPKVSVAAFSRDGRRIVTGGWDGKVTVYDLANGRRLTSFQGHRHRVIAVFFSSNDERLITTGAIENITRVSDATSGRELFSCQDEPSPQPEAGSAGGFIDTNALRAVTLSPDENWILTATRGGRVCVWDAHTGIQLKVFQGHTSTNTTVALSPDGQKIVTGGFNKGLEVWNVFSGQRRYAITTSNIVLATKFSPDGQKIVSATSGMDGGQVFVWDAATGRLLNKFGNHSEFGLRSVAISEDGTRIASGVSDGTVRGWDVTSGRESFCIRGLEEAGRVALSPDGRWLLAESRRTLDDNTGGHILESAKVWDTVTSQGPVTIKTPSPEAPFFPDGQHFIAHVAHSTRVFDAATGMELRTIPIQAIGFSGRMDLSPDGRLLAIANTNHVVGIWDVGTGDQLHVLQGHTGWVNSVQFSRDAGRIVTASSDKTVKVWDVENGNVALTLQGAYGTAALSPDGQRVLTGRHGLVKVWDASTGRELLGLSFIPESAPASITKDRVNLPNAEVHAAAFSPDQRRLLIAAGSQFIVCDADTGEHQLVVEGHRGDVTAVAFSPDGSRMITGGEDGVVKLWDSASGQELLALRGYRGTVEYVSMSQDSLRIICSGFGGITVWEAATPQQVYEWARRSMFPSGN